MSDFDVKEKRFDIANKENGIEYGKKMAAVFFL